MLEAWFCIDPATGRFTREKLKVLGRSRTNATDAFSYMGLKECLNRFLNPGLRAPGAEDGDRGARLQQWIGMIAELTLAAAPPDFSDQADERELLIRVQDGDSAAFDALVRRHLPRARLVASRLMQDPDDADDLVQDAFLRALERIATFDTSRAFEPWFTRILVNRGLDLRRKQALRRTEPHDPELIAGGTRPDREAERSELRHSLAQALKGLPDRQRLIVTMFEIDGHSTEEIADMLNVRQVTIRWHLHQARRTLRELMKGWVE